MIWRTSTLRTLANEYLGTLAEYDPLTVSLSLCHRLCACDFFLNRTKENSNKIVLAIPRYSCHRRLTRCSEKEYAQRKPASTRLCHVMRWYPAASFATRPFQSSSRKVVWNCGFREEPALAPMCSVRCHLGGPRMPARGRRTKARFTWSTSSCRAAGGITLWLTRMMSRMRTSASPTATSAGPRHPSMQRAASRGP